MKSILFSITIVLTLISYSSFANDSRDENVQFAPNTSSTSIKETITGYETVNYRLDAKAGQLMEVDLKTDNTANYFNIFVPGKGPGDEAMFIGSNKGNHYEGTVPADGKYTVQVYLIRSAARRNEKANYSLEISIDAADKAQKSTDETDYEVIDYGNFNETIPIAWENKEEWPADPVMVSLLFINATDSRTQTITRNYESTESPDSATVIVTNENLMDDSVSGVKYKLKLKKNGSGVWVIESVGKAVKCWEGRGHSDYSAKPCS